MEKSNNGAFQRTHEVWTPENWNDGYLDNKGRFRVYRPDYPRAYHEGYALRAHVVYWLQTGSPHPEGTELHHKDKTKDNDVFDNLVVLTHSQHQKQHKEASCTLKKCSYCGIVFKALTHRIKERGVKYCSQDCYQKSRKDFTPRVKWVDVSCTHCGKIFKIIPSRLNRTVNHFCSRACYHNHPTTK